MLSNVAPYKFEYDPKKKFSEKVQREVSIEKKLEELITKVNAMKEEVEKVASPKV